MTVLRSGKLTAWVILVAVLALLGYASRAAGGKPPKDAAYQYSTAVGGLVQYAIILVVVLAITRPEWWLLALRRPRAWGRTLGAVVIVFVAVYAASAVVSAFGDPGREQGLTPTSWDSSRAVPFAVNFVVFVAVAPFVEELTFRGLGYSLLAAARTAHRHPLGRRGVRPRPRAPRGAADTDRLRLRPGLVARALGQRLPGDGRPRDLQRDRADRRGFHLAGGVPARVSNLSAVRRVLSPRPAPPRLAVLCRSRRADADPEGAEGDHLPAPGRLRRPPQPRRTGRTPAADARRRARRHHQGPR